MIAMLIYFRTLLLVKVATNFRKHNMIWRFKIYTFGMHSHFECEVNTEEVYNVEAKYFYEQLHIL